ncbi:MAG TPA: TonB-dependent receptor, partial [Thermoanaerobaculales bacterium]|nr:TonB-dependent receptor [Thermoanaerobaculales bacterium]
AQVDTADLVVAAVADEDVPLAGVVVTVRSTETGLQRTAVTDSLGESMIVSLAPGGWWVSAVRDGFRAPDPRIAVLRVGQRARVELVLRPTVSDTIAVSGELPVVDLYKQDVSTNILPEQITTLPVPDRRFERLAFLSSNVQPDRAEFFDRGGSPVLANAGTGWANVYLVDGLDLSEPTNGQVAIRIGQDAIREFRAVSQRFDAEVGQTTGGGLAVVTKSGTNEVQGSLFGFVRSDALRAQGELEQDEVDFSRWHGGFTLGGPIARDRTHYFAAFEHVDEDDIALFRPGGAFAGLAKDVPFPTTQTTALVSLEHAFSSASSGTARLAAERYRRDNYQVGGVASPESGWSFDGDTLALLLGHTWVVSPDRLNDLRVLGLRTAYVGRLNSTERTEWLSFGTTLRTGANITGSSSLDEDRFQLQDTFHWQLGRGHDLRAGILYQHDHTPMTQERYEAGVLFYATDDRSFPVMYLFGTGSSAVTYSTDLIGLFIQDDWRPTARLTLGLGLRYDLDLNGTNPDFSHPLAGDRSRDGDNIQPRFGFTWDLAGDGRTVIRGGVGRYVGRLNHIPPAFELQFNGETGRVLQSRVGIPGLPLDPNDPDTSGWLLPPDAILLADDLEAPESVQLSLGVSRQLGHTGLVFEADAVYVEGDNELVFRDTNWGGNDNPVRPNPDYNKIDRYTSEGHSSYAALALGLSGTLGGGHLLMSSITFSDKKNIWDDAIGTVTPSDPADIEGEWGRSNTDERVTLVVSGIFRLPWGLALAPVYRYGSGRPWTAYAGYDLNGDGQQWDRLPGDDRMGQDGPRLSQLDLRLTKAFSIADRDQLELIVEAFNLFNTSNYDVVSVDGARFYQVFDPATMQLQTLANSRFGSYTATLSPREIQLGLRYVF